MTITRYGNNKFFKLVAWLLRYLSNFHNEWVKLRKAHYEIFPKSLTPKYLLCLLCVIASNFLDYDVLRNTRVSLEIRNCVITRNFLNSLETKGNFPSNASSSASDL